MTTQKNEFQYSLEFLVQKFEEDAVLFDNEKDEAFERWMKCNAGLGIPIPDHFLDPFNLAEALKVICKELLHIRTEKREETRKTNGSA